MDEESESTELIQCLCPTLRKAAGPSGLGVSHMLTAVVVTPSDDQLQARLHFVMIVGYLGLLESRASALLCWDREVFRPLVTILGLKIMLGFERSGRTYYRYFTECPGCPERSRLKRLSFRVSAPQSNASHYPESAFVGITNATDATAPEQHGVANPECSLPRELCQLSAAISTPQPTRAGSVPVMLWVLIAVQVSTVGAASCIIQALFSSRQCSNGFEFEHGTRQFTWACQHSTCQKILIR